MIRIERRLNQPRWLSVAVPVGSVIFAFLVIAVLLALTGHDPISTYRRLVNAAFVGSAAWSATLISATPLLFTGLAAAVAFRMKIWNIGGEGQLYLGALCASGIAIWMGPGVPTAVTILAMCACGYAGGALWALIPGVLRAFARTNEILTSLMLNYVAGLLLTYLIFDSASPWRDVSTLQARSFPQAIALQPSQFWSSITASGIIVPLGFVLALVAGGFLYLLFKWTRFGFEMDVTGDSTRAARFAGMRTRRKIVSVMALSGGIAGIGGASQIGDFSHVLDASPQGLQGASFGYTGIVVAALGRYNPIAVCLVGVLLGGLQNAGIYLQGADFPSGLVGVMEGIILFCTLGGEILIRNRVRIGRKAAAVPAPESPSKVEAT